jgi:hypothetical protein
MPVGLQLIGNYFSEGRLLNAAHRFQQATDFHLRRPEGSDMSNLLQGYEVVIGFETHAQLRPTARSSAARPPPSAPSPTPRPAPWTWPCPARCR